MSWRSVMISRPARLHVNQSALIIEQKEKVRVPFEDIAVIVLDHPEISLTHPVLSTCAEKGIGLYSTGSDHQPNGIHLPFLQFNRSTRMWRLQLAISRPRLKQAWAVIVKRKIENQAAVLRLAERGGAKRLESIAQRIRSGDPENLESQAALHYFPRLFDSRFHRKQKNWQNAALNYGYAVLRGAISRGLVAHGLHPSIGLFHDSERNAFNLADDLIEPFRPLVDLHVVTYSPTEDDAQLQPSQKAQLVALLNADLEMPNGTTSTLSAIEQAVESLARIYENRRVLPELELPKLIGLAQHQPEI